MSAHPVLLTLAAMLCGDPATICAVVMLPWAVMMGIYGMREYPVLACANIVLIPAAVFALGSYWHLVARTVKGLRFDMGRSFRVACVAALISVVAVVGAIPALVAALVVVPVVAATAWCVHLQRKQWSRVESPDADFER